MQHKMEMEIALRCGVKHQRIIWNGPIKNPQKLEEFLVAGGTDNIDSLDELEIVKGIVKRHPNITIHLRRMKLGKKNNLEHSYKSLITCSITFNKKMI